MTTETNVRGRLIDIARDYLSALVAHDFRKIRFSPDLKNTENGVELPVGVGAMRTVVSLREGGQFFVDVDTAQVEYWGVIDQIGGEVIYGVRLKIEGVLISEIETLLVTNTDPYYFPDVVRTFDNGFHDVIPAEKRYLREDLIAVADSYFDAIEQDDGTLVPVVADCLRLVNGAEDTVTDVSDLGASEAHRAMTVQAQITEKHYAYIEGVRARRYLIADEERGLILAHIVFDHPGDILKPDGSIPFGRPNSMIAFEVFKIVDGSITAVWALCHSVPYGMPTGWEA